MTDAEMQQKVVAHSNAIASRGDILMHGSKKRGEAAELFNQLAEGIAILAFLPGGVDAFGMHFEAADASLPISPTRPKS